MLNGINLPAVMENEARRILQSGGHAWIVRPELDMPHACNNCGGSGRLILEWAIDRPTEGVPPTNPVDGTFLGYDAKAKRYVKVKRMFNACPTCKGTGGGLR